ncbi:MAG: PEP-CTERM sorting domain-containing protein [Pirellulaceae bacterium]
MFFCFSFVFVGGWCVHPDVRADVIVFNDRQLWLAAVDQTTMLTADFEDFTQDVRFVPAPTGVGTVDAGPFSLSANRILSSSETLLPNRVDVAPYFGFNDANSNYAYILVEGDNNLRVTLTFDTPVLAFGADFDRVDGGPGESMDWHLNGSGSPILQVRDDDGFFGFISTGGLVNGFEFRARFANGGNGGTGTGMDNALVAFGLTSVPEPSSALLVIASFGGMLWRRQRS